MPSWHTPPSGITAMPSPFKPVFERLRWADILRLYPILMRLDKRGWLETRWENSVPQGRPRRHLYRLTGAGREWAREELRAAQQREFWKPAASQA